MTGYDFFAGVTDLRVERNKLHKLSDILFLSLCAVISGADDYEEIAEYGCQKEGFLRQFIELANFSTEKYTVLGSSRKDIEDRLAAQLISGIAPRFSSCF